jgi:hypothetical protein
VRRLAVLLASVLLLGMDVDEPTAAAGLKETLRFAARSAVDRGARKDGFFANPAIRIPVPEDLKPMLRSLKQMGLRGQVDEFERALNRAAETASGEAFELFEAEIAKLRFADARAIVVGGESAATEHFRRTASEELRARFAPSVERGILRSGLVQVHQRLLQHSPSATRVQFDANAYVSDQTLDGLFELMGQEERRIRSDPAARSAELERVFGRRPGS